MSYVKMYYALGDIFDQCDEMHKIKENITLQYEKHPHYNKISKQAVCTEVVV